MPRGLPILTTAVAGNPDVVEAGPTGLLVPARDPEALGQVIAALFGRSRARPADGPGLEPQGGELLRHSQNDGTLGRVS
jgi:glycosyltransferase involved in cell wall biosynthesis